jgi:hypothetical protein
LHVLPGKQALIGDESEFIDRQLRGRRRQHRAIQRHRVRGVAVQRGLSPVAIEQIRSGKQGHPAILSGQVSVEIIVDDSAILVLRVGVTTEVWMQKCTDVVDVRTRKRD